MRDNKSSTAFRSSLTNEKVTMKQEIYWQVVFVKRAIFPTKKHYISIKVQFQVSHVFGFSSDVQFILLDVLHTEILFA